MARKAWNSRSGVGVGLLVRTSSVRRHRATDVGVLLLLPHLVLSWTPAHTVMPHTLTMPLPLQEALTVMLRDLSLG